MQAFILAAVKNATLFHKQAHERPVRNYEQQRKQEKYPRQGMEC